MGRGHLLGLDAGGLPVAGGVLDLYSRRVLGWAAGDRLHKETALTALRRALLVRQPPSGLMQHSDRDSQ
jgi:transposase InsO family protein